MCLNHEKGGEVIQMNKPIVRKTDHERGMILVVATIVVIAMTIMATPFLAKLSSQYRITDKS
jgi:Tfp pilus assembly protein PilX